MSQLATKRSFNEPPIEFANAQPPILDFNHMLVLALEQALAPPIINRRSIFQPMRVIVVNHGSLPWPGGSARSEAQVRGLPARLLPRAVSIPNHATKLSHRAVRGEILSDERGQLYEKLGRQIRPLHQLASGPSGEVIDLIPYSQANPATTRREPVASTENRRAERNGPNNTSAEKPTLASAQESSQSLATPGYRKLFADPGQWRVLWWGEFKEILARQLAHPERLRDTYRLPCYVQVIETEREVSIEELASIYKSDKEPEARLYLLTEEIAAKLDLVLPLRPAPPVGARRTPNILKAHERVFRLLAANDPTIDVATFKSKQPPASKPGDTGTKIKSGEAIAGDGSAKDAIPSRFLKDWEFRISREEAIYDMNAKPTFGGAILKFLRRLQTVKTRNEISKWQTLLAGRSGDDQLWAVRPPADMLLHPFVSAWANRALELAGYDTKKMFIEWQIFWRRKAH